jgi:hypothetical protein
MAAAGAFEIFEISTRLLTYGAEPFLRSCQSCGNSRTSQHFMKPEGSSPCSQEPSTGLYTEPDRSNPYHPILSVKTKQRPLKMGGRTTYRTLPPKRTHFQTAIGWWPHLRKVPRREGEISHTHPMWLWGNSLFKISSPWPVLHGTKWLLWRSHIQSLTLHSRYGINKGLIKRGSTIGHWKSRCKGWISWPTSYTYIYIYIYIPSYLSKIYFNIVHPSTSWS